MSDEKKDNVKTHGLLVEKIYENTVLPFKPKCNTDSGFDVIAHNVKKIYVHYGSNGEKELEGEFLKDKFIDVGVFELQSGERALIGTGIKATVAPGYEIQMRPRSGLALKKGLTLCNAIGTIDYEYRGELCAIVINTSRQTQTIKLGEPIAQLVPMKVELLEVIEQKIDDETIRKADGFGSSSKFAFNDRYSINTGSSTVLKTTPFYML